MKNPFMPLKAVITDIKSETGDVKTYRISLDGTLKDPKPGQFNMLGYPGVGEAPISFSAISSGSIFDHTIRAVGKVTGFIARFKEGDEIFVRGPYGSRWPLKESSGENIILIAGGLGLAPMRPVIHDILSQRASFGKVTLIYGSKSPGDIIFKDEIDLWREYIEVLLTVDEVEPDHSWAHSIGLVTDLLDRTDVVPERTVAFICGPEIMMRFVSRGLFLQRFLPSRVYVSLERRMKCGIGQCGHCQHGSKLVCKEGPIFPYRDVNIFPDGLL